MTIRRRASGPLRTQRESFLQDPNWQMTRSDRLPTHARWAWQRLPHSQARTFDEIAADEQLARRPVDSDTVRHAVNTFLTVAELR